MNDNIINSGLLHVPNSLLVFHWWDEMSSNRFKLKKYFRSFFFSKQYLSLTSFSKGREKFDLHLNAF